MTDYISKVLRSDYSSLPQNNLFSYAGNIVARTDKNKAYDAIRPALDSLKTINTAFGVSLAIIESGDRTKIREKDLLQKQVADALNAVADGLDNLAGDDTLVIFNAGMQCRKAGRRTRIDPTVPTIAQLSPTSNQGEVAIVLQAAEGQRTYAFEWSSDGGQNWKNGQYSTRVRTTLQVAPHAEIWVRACSLGSGNLKSDFSEPAMSRSL
jgi:hypothetical protein